MLPVRQSLLEFLALVKIKGSELRIDRDVLRHVSLSVCAAASMHVDSRMYHSSLHLLPSCPQ